MESYIGLVDVGFLKAEGARLLGGTAAGVRPDARAVVNWCKTLDSPLVEGATFVRAYWYDGAFDPAHAGYERQRRFFDAIGRTPGIQLRLGHLAERSSRLRSPVLETLRATAGAVGIDADKLVDEFSRHWTFLPEHRQKGVDTLIALDLVRLAGRSAFDTAVLIAGDRDLAEAVRSAQDFGRRVVVAAPSGRSVAKELVQLADEIVDLDEATVGAMLTFRAVPTA